MNSKRIKRFNHRTMSQSQVRDYLFMECGGHCPECGMKMQNKNRYDLNTYMTVDHIIPKSYGGRKNIENLRPLCRKCNNLRGNKKMDVLAYQDHSGKWVVI